LRDEAAAQRLKLCPQAFEVVDLAIEDDADRPVRAEHWLIACDQIDDREATMSETDAGREEESFAVGPAMGDRVRHRLDKSAIGGTLAFCVKPAGNSAHVVASSC
jgi:hypothetical protein